MSNATPPLFAVGDKIKITKDKNKDYGKFLGKTGVITFVGGFIQGVRRYHWSPSSRPEDNIDVFENDLKKVNKRVK